jgi:hypothetical protein
MKCSDCKFFKTDECKLKPEAEFFVAEKFACFELDTSREASIGKHDAGLQAPAKTGGKWGISIGGTIFIVGIVGIIISIVLFGLGAPAMNDEDPGRLVFLMAGYLVLLVSFCIAVVGAIWWFVDWIAERKYWKSFETRDSNSDYNKTIKKS